MGLEESAETGKINSGQDKDLKLCIIEPGKLQEVNLLSLWQSIRTEHFCGGKHKIETCFFKN